MADEGGSRMGHATPEVKARAPEQPGDGAADGAGAAGTGRVLNPQQTEMLTQERRLLGALGAAITPLEPDPADLDALRQAGLDLDELFLLVVAGEFNAGKSAFINALLGERFLTEGVTPTTAVVTLLRYGDQPSEVMADADL